MSASLLQRRGFLPFYLTQLLGAFNDNLFKNAFVILVTSRGLTVAGLSPAILVTVISGLFILPFFLFSAFAGQLADKYCKTRIMQTIKVAEILIMGLAVYGFFQQSLPILLANVFLMGVHSTFFGPVKYSVLPQLLPDADLLRGNAWVETGTFLAILGGTIAGGLLVLLPAGTQILSAAIMLVAVCGWLASLRIPKFSSPATDLKISANIFAPTWSILALTRKRRSVFLSVLGLSWFWFLGAALLQLFPTYVKETLHGQEAIITLLLACFCIGIAIGSILVEKLSGRNLELGLVPLGSIGMTAFLFDLAAVPTSSLQNATLSMMGTQPSGLHILFDLLAIATFGGLFTVPLYTLLQKRVPKGEQSRVVGANNIVNSLFMALSSLLLAVLLSLRFTVPQILIVLGVLNAAIAIYIYRLLPEFLMRFAAWILSKIMYRRQLRGLENIPTEGPAVLVCNHVSFVDWLLIAGAIQRPVRFVMDHRIARIPVLSLLFRQAKAIPIAPSRESPAIKERAFERIAEELRQGQLVCIFPEGAITRDGEMKRFQPGIERIIRDTPVPVIPVAIDGLWGSIFSRKNGPALRKMPRRFRARLSLWTEAPIAPEAVSAQGLETTIAALLERMRAQGC